MFFEEEFTYEIIDDTITVDFLKDWCKENGITLSCLDNPTTWCAFAQWYGRTNGLDTISATSFSYIISSLFAGLGVSASTEVYIREEEIMMHSIEYLNELRKANSDVSEKSIANMLFYHIFDLYHDHIQEYEYKDEKLIFRIGSASMLRFMTVDGDTKSDKFRTLLQHYFSE